MNPDYVLADESHKKSGLRRWLTTTDHKEIGILYLWTGFIYFILGGIAALYMRWELYSPGIDLQIGVSNGAEAGAYFSELLSLHGTTMVFLWIMPALAGLGNYFVPIMIKAKDMAFPRINALSYWLIVPAGILLWIPMILPDLVAVNVTWVGYPPHSVFERNIGLDFWLIALLLLGIASTLGSINFLVTIFKMRAPDVTLHSMPLFVWAQMATSILLVFSLPVVAIAFIMVLFDRNFGTQFFVGAGDPILYQHLFWFFGHPEVYVLILPLMGVLNEVIPKFSRRPVFGYKSMAYAMLGIAIVGFLVWAHHMFTTGIDPRVRAVFMFNTMLVGVPTGIKVFNWLATMWGGQIHLTTPMKHALGFIWLFVIGGITGVMLGAIPVDYALHDSYFVVAHFHYTMVGGAVFGIFCGIYYWYPFLSGGRMYHQGLADWHFWLMFIGFNLTFFPQFLLGLQSMPRRYVDYDPSLTLLNQISTIGAFMIALSVLFFMINVLVSWRSKERITSDPWGGARHIEWQLWEEGRVVHGEGLIVDEEPMTLAEQHAIRVARGEI